MPYPCYSVAQWLAPESDAWAGLDSGVGGTLSWPSDMPHDEDRRHFSPEHSGERRDGEASADPTYPAYDVVVDRQVYDP